MSTYLELYAERQNEEGEWCGVYNAAALECPINYGLYGWLGNTPCNYSAVPTLVSVHKCIPSDSSYDSAVIIELIHGSFYDHDSFKNLHDMLMFQHVNTPEVLPVFVITASTIHFETRVRNYKKMYPNGYSKTKMRFVHLTSILPKISLESQLTLRTQKVLLELRTLSQ